MGVDVSHIIKHDFRKVYDPISSMEFVKNTIQRLKKNLLLDNPEEDFEVCYDEDRNETTFQIPVDDIEFTLHNGFWQIESYYHYYQFVMPYNGEFLIRRKIYDIAKALGQDEAWHAQEYYTWNGHGCEEPETTFEEWYERAIIQYGGELPDFNPVVLSIQGDYPTEYEPIYHDTFQEYR